MSLTSRGFSSEFLLSIGGLPRITPWILSGACPSMPMVLTDVWSGCAAQGIKTYLAAAEQIELSSTDAGDTFLGLGARQVGLVGLDNNWDTISEIVEMDGTNVVTTSQSFLRINEARVISSGVYSGSGAGANLGTITIESASTNNLEGVIGFTLGAPDGQMLNTHFCSPRGTRTIFRSTVTISVNQNMPSDVILFLRTNEQDVTSPPYGNPRVIAKVTAVRGATIAELNTPPHAPQRSDIWFASIAAQNNTPVAIQYSVTVTAGVD